MAKFCTRCGRRLEDGEVCNCDTIQNVQATQQATQQQATRQQATQQQATQQQATQQQATQQQATQQTQASASGFDFNLYFKKVVDSFVSITKKPVTAGVNFISQADISIALFFIVLQGIFTGLFSLVVCSKTLSTLEGISSGLIGSSSSKNNLIKIPYFKGFILTVLISVLLTGILALILFAANKMLKNNVTFNQMLSAASLRSVFAVYTSLIAMIIFLINPSVGVFCFFAGNMVGVVLIVMTLPKNAATENLVPIIMALAFFVFMIVSLFIMSKCWTIYIPDIIKEGMGDLKDLLSDPSKIMKSIY